MKVTLWAPPAGCISRIDRDRDIGRGKRRELCRMSVRTNQRPLCGFNPKDISRIFLTHLHSDHTRGCRSVDDAVVPARARPWPEPWGRRELS